MTEHKTQTFRGQEFKVVRGVTHPEYSYNTFEQEEWDFRNQFWNILPGDVVLDIGASYGSYSLTACSAGATVYSFEPEKTVFDDLVQSVKLNDWSERCFPENIGMWSSAGSVNMESYAPHWPKQTISGAYTMETIDHVVESKSIEKIDWIKIDVEGAEEHVVRGGMETIRRFKPKLLIECHVFLDNDLKDKVRTLVSSACNYEFEEVDRPPCIMLCTRPIK